MTPRQAAIRRTSLKILDDCSPHALPEGTLREHLDERERPRVSDAEWAEARTWLLEQGAMKAIGGSFGSDEARLMITEQGQVMLRQ